MTPRCAFCDVRTERPVFVAPGLLAQRVLDAALRPCSAECDPLYSVPRPLGWRPARGEVRLPGEPVAMKKRR